MDDWWRAQPSLDNPAVYVPDETLSRIPLAYLSHAAGDAPDGGRLA